MLLINTYLAVTTSLTYQHYKLFSKENLLNIYSTLLKHYEQSSVLEQNHEFYIEFDNKEKQRIKKYIQKHSLLNVLFLDEVSEGMREYQLEGIDWY